ncbi:hypothetical protein Sros01_60640 [Streptomyces roseochromogenus]|nr:hypothetical protein Sros01_60640 [Streptomyces roseochromogenus]
MNVATKAPSRFTSVLAHSHQKALGSPATLSRAACLNLLTDIRNPPDDVSVPPALGTLRGRLSGRHWIDAARQSKALRGPPVPRAGAAARPLGSYAWPTHRTS